MRLPLTWLGLLALLLPASGLAHPSRGIVVAPDGRIYFSDLERIWAIARSGRLTLVHQHRGVHTHALAMSRNGDLFGENSEYDPAGRRYTETIWRITRDGRYSVVYGPITPLPRGAGLLRDAGGCTYHSDQGAQRRPLVHRKCPGRPVERLVGSAADDRAFRPALINDIAGTALAADGTFYFRQGSAVRKISPGGRVSVVADGLAAGNYGIALDPRGHVHVAEPSARRIVTVSPDGRKRISASAVAPWSPTGVAVHGGKLLVLEWTDFKRGTPVRGRVREIAGSRSRTLAAVSIPLR